MEQIEQVYTMDIEQSLSLLKSDATIGLSGEEASLRLEQYGFNKLISPKSKSMFRKILEQFKNVIIIILIAASIVSAILSDGLWDAVIILAILLLKMIIGIYRENRVDNALKELKNLSSPKAKVIRDGQRSQIDTRDVVVGDIVILNAGDLIPADIRIIESVNLRVDESSLIGESLPTKKEANVKLESDAPLGDRKNQTFMGCMVTYGRGAGVVCATGMDTEVGKIAIAITENEDTSTPLQDNLNATVKSLGILCIALCAFVLIIGVLYDFLNIGEKRGILDMVVVSVALAVAVMPESAAIIAKVISAIGIQKIAKSNILIKELRTAEMLGSTAIICSDKTGRLTQNKMTVIKVADSERVYEVTGVGYRAKGHVVSDGGLISRNIALMSEIAVLCNDASYDIEAAQITGDPTEGAMLVFGAKLGYSKDALNAVRPRIHEIPFDPTRKMMSTFNADSTRVIMNTKGAPEEILKRSSHVYLDGEVVLMSDAARKKLVAQAEEFAEQALRVIAFAYKVYDKSTKINNIEDELVYVGLMCLIDPIIEESRASIAECHAAGINVKMITGDHKFTAIAIAQELGIMASMDNVMDSNDLDLLTDEELLDKVKNVNVFSRVTPEHKARIVTAIKTENKIVAITGGNVSDTPSLRKADIGIAMGISGADKAKDAADMIVSDDNFMSIVSAIEQARAIFTNTKKMVGYLLACHIGELLVFVTAILFSLPLPLAATQLLFIYLLKYALPGFALGIDSKEIGVMNRRPRSPKESIIDRRMIVSALTRAIFIFICSFGAFLYGLFIAVVPEGVSQNVLAMSMCFFTLSAGELLAAFPSKSNSFLATSGTLFKSKFVIISVFLSLLLLFAIMYTPGLNSLFSVIPLTVDQIFICSLLVLLTTGGFEILKFSQVY